VAKAGWILVIAGFLGGAFLASLDPHTVQWAVFAPVLAAGGLGAWLIRRARHAEAAGGQRLAGQRGIIKDRLASILANLEELERDKGRIPTYEARFEIDRRFRKDLMDFADARESLTHLYGVQAYADIMSAFAAGERYLNRVWSASGDGYHDEVIAYITRAHDQFGEAMRVLEAVQANADR
jgi:hypothetical protein